jgi:16S rRNA (cytidine1402-2'-O)-methyltransferase
VTNASTESAGTLYIVATPIGNLDDISPRAGKVLGAVALVAAEDTRRCGRLLAHLGLDRKLVAMHEHNEDARTIQLVTELQRGNDVALVSDAGTPLISDPGLHLVQAASRAGIAVVAVPGPSALTAALSVAGLATDRFVFEGFLPRRGAQRRARLNELASDTRTLVFFEAVHRISATVQDMIEAFGGERRAAIARELSKLHEQIARDTLAGLGKALGQTVPLRGEFVVLVSGADEATGADDAELLRIYGLLVAELPPSEAVALCARITGRSRNEVYALTRA